MQREWGSKSLSISDLKEVMKDLDKKHLQTVVRSEMEEIINTKSVIRQEIYKREDGGEKQ